MGAYQTEYQRIDKEIKKEKKQISDCLFSYLIN